MIGVAIISLSSCKGPEQPKDLITYSDLIPKPVSAAAGSGAFELNSSTTIITTGDVAQPVAQFLSETLKPATGFTLAASEATDTSKTNAIYLTLQGGDAKLGDEGYELRIDENKIKITANKAAGLFYGVQTLRQLLPHGIESNTKSDSKWIVAAGTITDHPEYPMRGAMLDVARHFFEVSEVKRYIDYLAFYKMNTLHLHLSDDQGWRIEIKSWPKLTEIGGSSEVGGGKGGFYTQEQYKDIVKYAQDRFITIIPEIDMPGHTNAALASYAELNCSDSAQKLYSGTEVGFSTFCTKKEVTYKFIDDVIRELVTLTPGPYIHIGGDESHATKKEDYIPFVNRVQEIVKKYNKQIVGWDEIALATLQPNTVAQFWADSANSTNAVKQGAKIMMSPAKRAYLDMQYDSTSKFGLHWAAYIEVDDAYNWDPAQYVNTITRKDIAGVEAPLWSETISNLDEAEYLAFPRLPGYAEIGWFGGANRSWDEYKVRLGKHGARMKAMGIDYYKSKKVDWKE
jgi:hexosaminidase